MSQNAQKTFSNIQFRKTLSGDTPNPASMAREGAGRERKGKREGRDRGKAMER